MEITISSFQRLLGEALRAIKPEHIMIVIATKMVVYNKIHDIMRKTTGRGVYYAALRSAWRSDYPGCTRSQIMKHCLCANHRWSHASVDYMHLSFLPYNVAIHYNGGCFWFKI